MLLRVSIRTGHIDAVHGYDAASFTEGGLPVLVLSEWRYGDNFAFGHAPYFRRNGATKPARRTPWRAHARSSRQAARPPAPLQGLSR
jgi:hypothetical protein